MNNHYIYPGYYGEVDRQIYEDLLSGKSSLPDDLAAEMRAQTRHLHHKQPLFEMVLDIICGTRKNIERQVEEYRKDAQNNPAKPR